MKKNCRSDNFYLTKLSRMLLIMRSLFIFLFVFSMNLTASSVYSQQKKMSISVKNASLIEVFQRIRQMSSYTFVYDSDAVKQMDSISVDLKEATIEDILDACLKGSRLIPLVEDNLVIIKEQKGEQEQKNLVRITGRVVDSENQSLPGVTVVVEFGKESGNATWGVITDNSGKYTITLPELSDSYLVFSFIGKVTQKIKYAGQNEINVMMKDKLTEMDEVVVTGYQMIDKRHLTSAVTTVKVEDIEVPGVNRIDALLEGRIPGLTFMQNTGQVGAAPKLRIRGTSTILGNQEPLWVVDGIVQQDPVNVDPAQLNDLDFVNLLGNAISGLNPDDIEQIDVLKDAAATALYGAKAANGVIVITTKKGKTGPPTVSYSFSGTFTRRPHYTDRAMNMMNSKERVDVSKELMERGTRYTGVYNLNSEWIGYEKAYLDYYKEGSIDFNEFQRLADYYATLNTDWLGVLTDNVFSHNHSLSINGGSEHIRYYNSIGYQDEQGNIMGEYNKRYSTSMKLTANYDKFTAQFGVNGYYNKKKYNPTELNVMSYAHSMSRAIPVYDEDGDLYYYNKGTGQQAPFNILNEMANSSNDIKQYRVTLNGQLRYNFTKDFKVSLLGSYSYSNTDEGIWYGENSWKVGSMRVGDLKDALVPFGGTLSTTNSQNKAYTLRLQADYSKYLGKERQHFINVMAGYEVSSSEYNTVAMEQRGYFKDRGKTFANFDVRNESDFGKYLAYYRWKANNNPNYTDALTNTIGAYLTLTYSYNDKYILNLNTRADWSNAFGSRSNEKLFPVWSVSGRWNINNDLLKNVAWVDNLALRLSYGIQGNMLSNQPTRLTINKGGYDETLNGYTSTINNYPNPNLKWEKTNSYNIGLDFSFLDGRINGSIAYYYKRTKDAFLLQRVGSFNGVTAYTVNAGDLENQGMEVAFRFTPINNKLSSNGKRGFVWRIDPQLGQAVNSLLNKAFSSSNSIVQDELKIADLLNGKAQIAGEPLNTFYSYRYAGLNNTGSPTFHGLEENRQDELTQKYSVMYANDKKDVWMAVLGKSGTRVPVIQGGLNNYFAYRNFSLSVNFTYSIGNKVRLFKLASGEYNATRPNPYNNIRKEFVNRWLYPGDEKHTDIPGLTPEMADKNSTGNASSQDRYYGWWRKADWAPVPKKMYSTVYELYDNSDLRVVRGDYLRLSSLVFRYVFNKELLQHVGLKSAYVQLAGTNLFTVCSKKLKGQNPEQSGTSDIVNISIRPTYSMSLNINF